MMPSSPNTYQPPPDYGQGWSDPNRPNIAALSAQESHLERRVNNLRNLVIVLIVLNIVLLALLIA